MISGFVDRVLVLRVYRIWILGLYGAEIKGLGFTTVCFRFCSRFVQVMLRSF